MQGHYVLLVEDDEDQILLTLQALKRRLPDTKVVVVKDGQQAIDFLTAPDRLQLPRVVLLDLKLPKVNGLEVLSRIRSHPPTQWLPIVVLTSSDEEIDLKQSYRLGANSYIRKPVDYTQFADNIERTVVYWTRMNTSPP